MIDVNAWGWPQYISVTLMVVGLCAHGAMHGKQRQPYNAAYKAADVIIAIIILSAGGFFS